MSDCVRCGVRITDETLRHVYYNEDYPEIDIGPYCMECLSGIRVCSGCHYPFTEGENIKYFGDCLHYCDTCAEGIETCEECGKIRTVYAEVEGKKLCESCFSRKYRKCKCCDTVRVVGEFNHTRIFKAQNAEMFERYPEICKSCCDTQAHRFNVVAVLECQQCGNIYGATEGAHRHYCPGCVLALPKCNDCNEPTGNQYNARIRNGETLKEITLCDSCIKGYKVCESCMCHSKTSTSRVGRLGVKHVCDHCSDPSIGECPNCFAFKKIQDNGVCAKCNSRYMNNLCTDCGSIRDDRGTCRACGDRRTHIYNYTLKPHIQFHYTPKDDRQRDYLFFGIENEVSFDNSTQQSNALKRIYQAYDPTIALCKSDASISGYGFEIVTQPMTLNYFHKFDLSQMFSRTFRHSSSCGTHIHVNREAFKNDLHIFKVTNFIHTNKDFINLVSGRDYNGYNRELKDKVSKVVLRAKKNGGAERHVRVNLRNEKTIEFRMFAGCVKEFDMRYRVEFLHALIKWAEGAPLTSTSIDSFIDYVKKKEVLYENLNKFLKKNWRS